MTTETPEGVTEVEGPPEQDSPPKKVPKEEKEQTMAAEDQAAPQGLPMLLNPMALMGNNINWVEMMNQNMDSMHQATMGSMKFMMACQEATFALWGERLHKNQEMLRRCSETREPADLVHEGAEYHRAAVEDYVRYTKDIADMTLAVVNEQIEPLEKRTQETLNTVSKAA